MEYNKTEIEALECAGENKASDVIELREMDLALVGGGSGEVVFN